MNPEPDWGASGREDSYSFALVDPLTLEEVGEVRPDAASSSLTYGYYTDNIYSGSLVLKGSDYRVGGYERLVRVKQRVRIGAYDREFELATMFVDSLSARSLHGNQKRSLSCYSTLWRSTQDKLAFDFFRRAGENVVEAIRSVVEADGGIMRVMDGVDEGRAFGGDIWFELGTNKATVANTMAGWIDCQIGVDGHGFVTLSPYVAPVDKAVSYTFEEGGNCTYLPGIDWETTRGDALNRVVAYFTRESKEDGDPYPLTDRVMVDLPESSEFSWEKCGRRRTEVLSMTEPCSHADLEAKARAYLAENSGESLTIQIEHVGIPTLKVGDVVRYVNECDHGGRVDCRCLVAQTDIQALTPGAKSTSKLKIVGWC